jgi:competence protein ComEC
VSVAGFVANLVAIPWVTLVVTPLALLGAIAPPLWTPAAVAVGWLVSGLQQLASVPWAVWAAPAAPAWAVAAGLLAGAVGMLPLPWRLRLLALPLALPLMWPPVPRPPAGGFELVAVDIGQGTAVLVRTRSHLLVYDTGPAYARDGDAGQRILVPLLRARGDQRIDLLVLTHRDNDHVGGAEAVLAAVPVQAWSSSLDEAHPLRRLALPRHVRCDAGQQWEWDGVRFEMLHPTGADHARERRPNALSCVLRVQDAAGRSALLTGDVEAAQEAALVARLGARLRSTLLLVPHHGSRTSSSEAFIDAVAPQVAVVQAGYRSRFGHPAAEVSARYQSRGIMLVRNDRCGAWTWHDGASECARTARRRYWHWRIEEPGAELAARDDAGDTRR